MDALSALVGLALAQSQVDPSSELLHGAEQRAYTTLLAGFLHAIPDRSAGRRTWVDAVTLAPRSHAILSQREIFVDWPVGAAFHDRFAFHMTAHERRVRGGEPMLSAFCYLLEATASTTLEAAVHKAVSDAMQGVSPRSAAHSSPSPS